MALPAGRWKTPSIPKTEPVLEQVCKSLEGDTQKQKNPHPKGSLAYAAWVFARLGGWTGYYGKPGPIVMLRGLTEFHAIKHGSWGAIDQRKYFCLTSGNVDGH